MMTDIHYHQSVAQALDILARRGLPGGAEEAGQVAILHQEAARRLQAAQVAERQPETQATE